MHVSVGYRQQNAGLHPGSCPSQQRENATSRRNITYDGHLLHGLVDNVPEVVTSIHWRDSLTVEPGEIIDWKYTDDGKLVGGYTIRAYYYEGTPSDKQDILNSGYTPSDMVRNY